MGEVVKFIPRPDSDRTRLIQQARSIYESIFPTEPVSIAPAGTASIISLADHGMPR
jgi:hypothetical protein